MKACLAALVALLATTPLVAQPFEGTLEAPFELTVGSGEATLFIAPEGVRAEVTFDPFLASARQQVFLLRASEPDRLYRIDPEARTYEVLDADDVTARALRPETTYEVLRTTSGEVAGLPAQRSEVRTSEGDLLIIWTSPEVPDDAAVLRAIGIDASEGLLVALEEAGLRGAILRLIQYPRGGVAPAMELEVTRIERQNVDPSLFELPTDLTRVP